MKMRLVISGTLIEIEVWTEDAPNLSQIEKQQGHFGDTEGNLYAVGFPVDDRVIGRWREVNEEAEEWRRIATLLYEGAMDMGEYIGMGHGFSETQAAEKAIEEYKKKLNNPNGQ